MLPVTGYVDRWSVRPGETIRFMISSRGGAPYRARLARVFCGDPNPAGPGYREQPVPCAIAGEHQGREQPVHPGSRAMVPALDLAGGAVSLALTFWPSLPELTRPQTLLHWQGGGVSLRLLLRQGQLAAELSGAGGTARVTLPSLLPTRHWADAALVLEEGRLTLACRARPLPYAPLPEVATASAAVPDQPLLGQGQLMLAAGPTLDDHFNGRIERPVFRAGHHDPAALLDAQQAPPASGGPGLLAAWDFSVGIDTDRITDLGPQRAHGLLHNLPTRAVTGANWTGRHFHWPDAPAEYGAIHFHDDDVGDLGWVPSLELRVPAKWPSGLYALHLENGTGTDNIPFVVRAAEAGSQASVAMLVPTLTYQIYGQYPRGEMVATAIPRAREWGALDHLAAAHPEYGLCAYNTHSDGSGVSIASMRRPMMDKRVNQIHREDASPGGSGTYWLAADTYLIDWLDRRGIPCELITDHDLHAEGAALLRRYAAVLTGQHPEYHTEETRGAIADYIAGGGRFLYLGGNGFYWKIAPFRGETWAMEVRRAEGGIRTWAAEPGEGCHAFDGSPGGLWRRLGKPPQALVGVGFTSQGDYHSEPYYFTDAVLDPRLDFLCDALGDQARPGVRFGERGLMGGGAAGHEMDRADTRLGTPPHTLVLAVGLPQDPRFEPANEERLTQEWPGTREEIIRSDIVFFETAAGGAVFSVGSMSFIGGLPVDGYNNTLAQMLEAVLRRFCDPKPFSWPKTEAPALPEHAA
jgi:N,N-dimethylformamidase